MPELLLRSAADVVAVRSRAVPAPRPGSAGYHGRGDGDGFCENAAASEGGGTLH